MISSSPLRAASGVVWSSFGVVPSAGSPVVAAQRAVATTAASMGVDAMASRSAPHTNKISMSLALQLAFAQLMRGGDPLLSGLINAHIVSVPGPMKYAA